MNDLTGGKKPPAPPSASRIPTFATVSKIPTGTNTPSSMTPPAASPALSPLQSPRSGPSPCNSSSNLMVGRSCFSFSAPGSTYSGLMSTPVTPASTQDPNSCTSTPQYRSLAAFASPYTTAPGTMPAPPLLSCDSPLSSPVSPQTRQEPVEWDGILVAVRVRPLSDKERNKSEREVWTADENSVTGTAVPHARVPVRYHYDTVFGPSSNNEQVYNTVARNMIPVVLNGFNATVFAYGVTSSGKTHTIMGCSSDPGVTPRVIRDVFVNIENQPGKQFLMRMSIMEIYNEVINDLLDVTRVNLKIREDSQKQVQVEGLTEEVVVNAEQALALIAMGDANRKVSATAFNEDSSRSHTICRMSIESADKGQSGRTCLSYINIIDLAGSESAKAAKNVGHRLEGSYINKSLLTLGTVIHKLAETRNDQHIPFRDSKLTRLLQGSLSGTGAKVAIVCNITPSSGQMDETHNTLKFASRAKMIRIQVSKNEIVDAQSMIKQLQAEIAGLREQLTRVQTTGVNLHASAPAFMGMPREGMVDRARLEMEMQSRLLEERQKQEAERACLDARLNRLTGLLLSSSKALAASAGTAALVTGRPRLSTLQRSHSAECASDMQSSPVTATRRTTFHTGPFNLDQHLQGRAPSNKEPALSDPEGDCEVRMPSVLNLRNPGWAPVENAMPTKRSTMTEVMPPGSPLIHASSLAMGDTPLHVFSAGDIHVGKALLAANGAVDVEKEILKEQLQVLANEFEEKHKEVQKLKNNAGLQTDSSNEVEWQVMYADREMLQDQLCATEITNERLMRELEDSNSEIQKLQRRVDHLEVANQKLQQSTSQATANVPEADEHLKEENEKLRAEVARLQQQLLTRPAGGNKTGGGDGERESGASSWKSRTTSEDRESEDDLEGHLHTLEQQVVAAMQEVAKRDEAMKEVEAERAVTEQERDQLAQNVATLQKQLEEAARQLWEKEEQLNQMQPSRLSDDGVSMAQEVELQIEQLQQVVTSLQNERERDAERMQEAMQKLEAEKEAQLKKLVEEKDAEMERLREAVKKLEQREALQEQMESFKRKVEARSRRPSADGSLTFSPEKVQTKVMTELQAEVACLKASNNRLHGYELEQLSPEELVSLIGSLTQAVERVRVTVQARRTNPSHSSIPSGPAPLPPHPPQNPFSGIPSPPPIQPSA